MTYYLDELLQRLYRINKNEEGITIYEEYIPTKNEWEETLNALDEFNQHYDARKVTEKEALDFIKSTENK